MKAHCIRIAAVLLASLLTAGGARAQIFTPSFMSPVGYSDLGVYLSEGPGDFSLEGIWRSGPLGLRAGLVDADPDDLLSVGGELRSPIPVGGAPVGLAFTAGAQGLIGDVSAFGLQVGLSAGHRFMQPGLALTPYLHPRLAFINGFGPGDDFESEVIAEIGLDVEIPSNLILRTSVGLSDDSADWGIGLAWRR